MLKPLVLTFQYSLYRWDGIGPSQWVGLKNYATVLTDPDLVGVILNAFKLIVFFSRARTGRPDRGTGAAAAVAADGIGRQHAVVGPDVDDTVDHRRGVVDAPGGGGDPGRRTEHVPARRGAGSGLASALAVVLFILVLACVLPIQRLARGDEA